MWKAKQPKNKKQKKKKKKTMMRKETEKGEIYKEMCVSLEIERQRKGKAGEEGLNKEVSLYQRLMQTSRLTNPYK